jgi:NADH:ubiquinone oxidoreductase subunit 3 (subunit A)
LEYELLRVSPAGVLVGILLFTLLAFFIVLCMNEKLKYTNEERLSLSVLQRTITDCEVQQPLEIDSLISAAYDAGFVAIKNATLTTIKKTVLCEDAANIL